MTAGFNVQFKGTCFKCDEYVHKSDSPKCPENQGTNISKSAKSGNSKNGLNKRRQSNTKCWDSGKLGHKRSDFPERETANQEIDIASKSSVSHEELDLMLCTMDNVIIEQLYEESISLANEVALGTQDKNAVK